MKIGKERTTIGPGWKPCGPAIMLLCGFPSGRLAARAANPEKGYEDFNEGTNGSSLR